MPAAFVACADNFVAGRSVEQYLPTDAEQKGIVQRINESEQSDDV